MSTPKCAIDWCIALAADGSTMCSVHTEYPDYKPQPEPDPDEPKPNYVYIICEEVDGLASFRHCLLIADNDDDAYELGRDTLEQPEGNGINDYVVRLDL